jgi:hypothetical protein
MSGKNERGADPLEKVFSTKSVNQLADLLSKMVAEQEKTNSLLVEIKEALEDDETEAAD